MLRDGDFSGFDLIVNRKFHFLLFPEDLTRITSARLLHPHHLAGRNSSNCASYRKRYFTKAFYFSLSETHGWLEIKHPWVFAGDALKLKFFIHSRRDPFGALGIAMIDTGDRMARSRLICLQCDTTAPTSNARITKAMSRISSGVILTWVSLLASRKDTFPGFPIRRIVPSSALRSMRRRLPWGRADTGRRLRCEIRFRASLRSSDSPHSRWWKI